MLFNGLIAFNFFFSTIVIFCNNVLYAIISLVLVILGSCCILLLLKVEFLSFILLLIYIGAILILFLFLVTLLQLNADEVKTKKKVVFSKYNLIYAVLGLKVFIFIYFLHKKLCVSLNLLSYDYLQSNDITNVYFNTSLILGNDAMLFLSIFTQKFYVTQAKF